MMRILILEDSDDDLDLIVRSLQKSGMEILFNHARSEKDFQRLLKEQSPDVILSDYALPGYSGMAALEFCQKYHAEIPFIFISGTIGEEIAVDALKFGATDYVLKDRLARLPAAVRRSLREFEEIKARIRAEKEIKLQSAALNAAANAIMITEPDGQICWVNAAYTKLTGYVLSEIQGKNPRILKSGQQDSSYYQNLWKTILSGEIWKGELINLRKDGTLYYEAETITPLLDAQGKITHFIAIKEDISERKQYLDRIQRLSRIREVLGNINSLIVRAPAKQELFEEACRLLVRSAHFHVALIDSIEINSAKVTNLAAAGEQPEHVSKLAQATNVDLKDSQSLLGQAIRSKKTVYCNDIATEIIPDSERRRIAIALGYRSLIVLPLLVEKTVVAAITLLARPENFFDQDELKLLSELAADISFALAHLAQSEKARFLAYYNPETGLPNRQSFEQRLAVQLQGLKTAGQQGAVVHLDIERFRNVNDTLGRSAGNQLLRLIGARLQEHGLENMFLAHLERDHFGLIVAPVTEAQAVAVIVTNLQEKCFRPPFMLYEQDLFVSARAGIALYPDDGLQVDALMRNADSARVRARTEKENLLFYRSEMNERVSELLLLENDLRVADEAHEFFLEYQPKMDLQNGQITGLEALLRWRHPVRGSVPPLKFIPLLEETGLIFSVGQRVIELALEQAQKWKSQGLKVPAIAVNVSALQLGRSDFPALIETLLSKNPGVQLEIEITETIIMQNAMENIAKLEQIRQMGVAISIDDFGTGYSSLNYIARLPVDRLKIDQSFVKGMSGNQADMTVVSTIISLSHQLGLQVVAEGVENENQAALLKALRCNQAQGYLYSKPLSARNTAEFLVAGRN